MGITKQTRLELHKLSTDKMEREPMLSNSTNSIEAYSSQGVDNLFEHEHQHERSYTSHFSVVDLENEVVADRIVQLASLLEKSANQLRHHASTAHKERHSRSPRRKQILSPKITENLLPITALWQALCILALSAVDVYDRKVEKEDKINLTYKLSVSLICVFQFVNLILVFSATVKLTKQYLHKTASMRFLINGYFSMIVLFAGLYMLIFKIKPSSFTDMKQNDSKSDELSIVLFIRMLNVSISTGTLCGSANVTAKEWYSGLAMSFQMLISFVYFASFLSQVLSPANFHPGVSKRYKKKPDPSTSKEYASV